MKQRLYFSFSIFFTAFLLFLIEPMVAKIILPYLGGSQNVWNVCLVFYQCTLLLGYLYADFIRRRINHKKAKAFHTALLIISVIFFMPLDVNMATKYMDSPVIFTLISLFKSIFVPFFVLSTASPLIQSFFATSNNYRRDNPYFLYKASNFGSFLALIMYPFLIEPNLDLKSQKFLWSTLYIIAMVLIYFRQKEADFNKIEYKKEEKSETKASEKLWWGVLGFIPAALMIGLSNKLTMDITPMPLLWALPLGLYLFSFLVSFSDFALKIKNRIYDLHLAFVSILILFMASTTSQIFVLLIFHLVAFFMIAVVCHLRLYEAKPKSENLTVFYFYMALGGALGGIFSAIVAPVLFNSVIEYPILLVLSILVRPFLKIDKKDFIKAIIFIFVFILMAIGFDKMLDGNIQNAVFLLSSVILVCGFLCFRDKSLILAIFFVLAFGIGKNLLEKDNVVLKAGRSFYSTYKVVLANNKYKVLQHGNIYHGAMDIENPTKKLTYYSETSPISRLFNRVDGKDDKWDIALIGLGVGSAVCFAKPNQKWDIYEIDAEIVELSTKEKYFSFIKNCKNDANIIVGDGRIAISKQDKKYDLIIVDVFSSDAIPAHLLTKEAFNIYLNHLRKDGIILFHISNNYVDIEGIINAVAKNMKLEAKVASDFSNINNDVRGYNSSWAIVSRQNLNEYSEFFDLKNNLNITDFSDEYSSIYKAFNFKIKRR